MRELRCNKHTNVHTDYKTFKYAHSSLIYIHSVMWCYFFLIVKLIKFIKMQTNELKQKITEVFMSFEEFPEANTELFVDDILGLFKKEYEEKLRWIPIEEKLPEYSTINSKNRVNVKFKNIHGEEEICSAELCQITQHCGENSPLLNVWYPFSACCPLKNVISWRSFL